MNLRAVLQLPVLARTGERVGQVRDLVARLPQAGYPAVVGFVVRVGGRELFLPVEETAGLGEGSVRLSVDRLDVRSFERRPGEILLGRDLLGHHVIHVDEARLARVGDLELARRDGGLQVVGVCAAPPGLLARLPLPFGRHKPGAGGGSSQLAGRSLKSAGRRQRMVFDWSSVEPLVGHVPTAGRRLPFTRLRRLHPAELADLVEAASPGEGEEIMTAVGTDPAFEAEVFEELDVEHQVEFLRARPDAEAAEVLAHMSPDEAADLVLELDEEHRQRVLGRLPLPQLHKVRMLLGYHPETAGGLMSPEFLLLPSRSRVEAAVEEVRRSRLPAPNLSTIYVADDSGQLTGAVSLADLVRQEPASPLCDVVTHDPVVVEPYTDIPGIARKMTDFNLGAVPVVDQRRHVIGIVTVDDLLEAMLPADWRALTERDASIERNHRSESDRP